MWEISTHSLFSSSSDTSKEEQYSIAHQRELRKQRMSGDFPHENEMERLHTSSVDNGNDRHSPQVDGTFKTSTVATGELQLIFHSVIILIITKYYLIY